MTDNPTPAADWRVELMTTLGIRIPIALLLGGTLWGVWDWGLAAMEDHSVEKAALTAIVAECVGE